MRITIVGAYGYTGRLIVEKLKEYGIRFNVCGRSTKGVQKAGIDFECDAFVADIRTADGIKTLCDRSDLIVNCAGPFTEESSLLVQSLADLQKIYIDISGELPFVRYSILKYDKRASSSGSLIFHACAFESLPAVLMMRILSNGNQPPTIIRTFYNFSNSRPSPGTRLTMKLARFRPQMSIAKGRWTTGGLADYTLRIRWPDRSDLDVAVSYPLPEVAFAWRNYKPSTASSHLLLTQYEAAAITAASDKSRTEAEIICAHDRQKLPGPTMDQRARQQCRIIVQLQHKGDSVTTMACAGADMYGITAKAVCLVVEKVLTSVRGLNGVLCPSVLFPNDEENALVKLGLHPMSIDSFGVGDVPA